MEVFNNIKKQFDISQIITKKNNSNNDKDLEAVAQEFESLFVYQLLKNARKAKLSESLFSNQGTETYESLLDQEYARTLSKNHSFGIAEALLRQFGGK